MGMGRAAERTDDVGSAHSVVLLNIFYLPVDLYNAIALSYERLPMVFIPGR
jgi:hypothetical protein